jgi:hypothetical protein
MSYFTFGCAANGRTRERGDCVKQLAEAERFREPAVGTDFLCSRGSFTRSSSHHQRWNVVSTFVQGGSKSPAIQHRHVHIENDERGRLALDERKGLGSIRCDRHSVPAQAQRHGHRMAQRRLVLYDENETPVPFNMRETPALWHQRSRRGL